MSSKSGIRGCAAGALALGLVGITATASAQQTVVVAEPSSRGPSAFLLSSGLITTGLSYTPALVVAINSDNSADKYLYAPFAGPWMDLAARENSSQLDTTLLVVDGVFQTIGAVQIIASFLYMGGGTEVAKADRSSSVASQTIVAPARLARDGYGLVAMGHF